MSEISVSVMVLTFNSAKFIEKCLVALKGQTFNKFEVVIVDAGSSDTTLQIIEKWRSELTINLIDAPGSSIGEARNIALDASKGQYLVFCDSDDIFFQEKISKQVAALELADGELLATYSDFLHFEEDAPFDFYSPRPMNRNFRLAL